MDEGKPEWDETLAEKLRGAIVMVGITWVSTTGESLEQFYGIVSSAIPEKIELRLCGTRTGDSYFLPPDLRAFHPAAPGSYRLRETGEVIENPDYTTTWTINSDED